MRTLWIRDTITNNQQWMFSVLVVGHPIDWAVLGYLELVNGRVVFDSAEWELT